MSSLFFISLLRKINYRQSNCAFINPSEERVRYHYLLTNCHNYSFQIRAQVLQGRREYSVISFKKATAISVHYCTAEISCPGALTVSSAQH